VRLTAAGNILYERAASILASLAETQDTLRDFLVQNVCLGAGGAVLPGVAPIDGDRRCAAERDLRPGERLPYHKHDHSSPDQRAIMPSGYQRHDSFPVETAGFGTVVEHSFDFGVGDGRRFGVFETGSDGGDIAVLSPGIVSIGATEAGGGGFGLWVGECRGPLTATALTRSWIIVEYDPARPTPLEGETIARLNGVTAGGQSTCPTRFNPAYTSWRVVPFRYRAAPGQGTPITLATQVIYPWYTEGAHGWGLNPIDDQVLGGLLMWIGQGTYLMFVFTFIFYKWSQTEDRDVPILPATTAPELRVLRSHRGARA